MNETTNQDTTDSKRGLERWFSNDESSIDTSEALSENKENISVNEQRIELAATFFDDKDHVVHKVTRAGFTTSFVKAASRSEKRVLLIAPTRKIINDTMGGTADIVRIYGNAKCYYNEEAISKEPLLAELPMSIPKKCNECKYADDCCILDIEREPDAQMKSLTSAKFEAIMCSDGDRSLHLREILQDIDVVLIDEAHYLAANDVARVPLDFSAYSLALKLKDYHSLRIACFLWEGIRGEIEPIASDLERQVEYNPDCLLIRELDIEKQIISESIPKFWGELRKLARKRKELDISEEEVLAIRDIISILCNDTARLSHIREDGVGKLYVCGKMGRLNGAIHNYLNDYAKNASVVFVSGTMFEPFPDFFKTIVGRENLMKSFEIASEQDFFPDLLRTNAKMTVYADTFRLSGTTPQKMSKIPKIVDRIKEISEAEGDAPIHLFAPNITLHERLRKELRGYPNIFCDYYRSENTIGVKGERRIAIAVGLAEVPKNAYDCLANSYKESQTIRVGSVDAATWQAWSRVKDPAGETPSKVYCIGVKKKDVSRVLTWGPGRVARETGTREFVVECREELPKPVIMEPYKKQVHPEQRKASPYIKKIWDTANDLTGLPDTLKVYDLEIPIPENSKSTLINYIRDFGEKGDSISVPCFGALFSKFNDSATRIITTETLDRFFRSKKDQHAEQQKYRDRFGRIGYRPHITNDWDELIFDMILGLVSPATYGVGEDGLTVQCAFDIDNHNGDNPSVPRLEAVVEHLTELGIQPIVVASGSQDSYHVYIPIIRAPIEIVHNFMKTLKNKLQKKHPYLDFKNDTEAFPKQKTKHAKFGNALKLPMAVNRKTGVQSKLLDPYTFEFNDFIVITRVVELREPEKEAEKVGTRQYLPSKPASTHMNSDMMKSSGSAKMRPCILAALDETLYGSQSHDMRVAIVCEAKAAGKTREETIAMFKPQRNFDRLITTQQVDNIIYNKLKPWKCETLRAKCSKYVDCANCPWKRNLAAEHDRGKPAWDVKLGNGWSVEEPGVMP